MAPTHQQAKEAKQKLISGGKPPKARVQRYLTQHSEPKLLEDAKSVLLLKGLHCSNAMSTVLKDLTCMLRPYAKSLSKKNAIAPFEEDGRHSLEFLTTKNDCSIFALASHNKKRPNNLTIGRTYDRHILDIAELGIVKYVPLEAYKGCPKKRTGSKPMLLFQGEVWQLDASYERLQNVLVDMFRGTVVDQLLISSLDHVIMFTAVAGSQDRQPLVYMRTYYCKLTKNREAGGAPLPLLTPSGPDMDFYLRRTDFATPDIYKLALKQPKTNRPKKIKNQSTNVFGETIGRLHLDKQNVMKTIGKKSKALRKAEKEEETSEKTTDAMQEKLVNINEKLNDELKTNDNDKSLTHLHPASE